MEEKTYLKWYNKVGYGTGDIAGNVVYAFLSSFVMIYLTNTVGLNSGIVGTLIAVSKLFDGVTDIFFGTMIDRTKSRMGKARPWMFYGFFGCAVTLFGVFAIPTSLGKTAQYAWFFIAYTLLNAVFYTANNIAYAALTSLVTKNSKERVQMGSFRFMFSFGTNLVIQSATVGAVEMFGGGVQILAVGSAHPGVARERKPLVLLADDHHAGVFCPELLTDGKAAIRGAIVHHDDLKVLVALAADAFQTAGKSLFHVVNGHDHADERGVHGVPPSQTYSVPSFCFFLAAVFRPLRSAASSASSSLPAKKAYQYSAASLSAFWMPIVGLTLSASPNSEACSWVCTSS